MNLDQFLSQPAAPSMAEFARQLGLNQDLVRQWRHKHDGRRPSPENAAAMERASDGLMTCEELRPDLTWTRIADRKWPHKKGRPLVDVARDTSVTLG